MSDKHNPYVVAPVRKALSVLELVAERAHDVSLATVTRELKIPKTTSFRYLQTLTEAGFLIHDLVNDKYSVGPRFRAIAKADTSLHRLRKLARPHMHALVAEFNETVNLGLMFDGNISYVDIIEANQSLRIQGRVGDRHPLHSTALGKAILAHLPDAQRKLHLARPLALRTSRTLTDVETLERQLRQSLKLGYATETEENDDGATCVGAAVLDDIGYPIAAISLSAPRHRMPRETLAKAGARLAAAAHQISAQIAAA
ncbi:MAG: IclR family transcriptional regulator [Devosia nanyangense]|uniref:IclR family transcriptional regulator n=1 Tax=Devosia nanyangense TaxID=1228055 RepID=A0A933L6M2_9HYPH|nr:IclR family transcriptional regulator [Devosia nanyangense]